MSDAPRHLRAVRAAETATDEPSAAEITCALVERARNGDMNAWARLYRDHFTGLYAHIRYLSGDPQLAEELVQETFVQALPRIDHFDGRSTFATWLHGIAINIVRNHWRARRSTAKALGRLQAVEAVRPRCGEDPEAPLARKQRVKALYAALETLPDPLRLAFVLRDLQGMSPEDAARSLGISQNNLSVRACRARERLRKILSQEGSTTCLGGPS